MKSTTATRQSDAIAVLKTDHKEVRGLLERLVAASGADRRRQLFEKIHAAIKTHSACEEEIFYPAYREAAKKKDDRKLFFEATEEHHVVDGVLAELKGQDPATDEFAAKSKVLQDLIEHHADEEEDEMFPRARRLLSDDELIDLGSRIEARKGELEG